MPFLRAANDPVSISSVISEPTRSYWQVWLQDALTLSGIFHLYSAGEDRITDKICQPLTNFVKQKKTPAPYRGQAF